MTLPLSKEGNEWLELRRTSLGYRMPINWQEKGRPRCYFRYLSRVLLLLVFSSLGQLFKKSTVMKVNRSVGSSIGGLGKTGVTLTR